MTTVWREMELFNDDHPQEYFYGHMKLSMFCQTSNPNKSMCCMKGRAAEVKTLGRPLRHVWKMHMVRGDTHHENVLLALDLNCRLEQILDENPDCIRLPPVAATEFEQSAFAFCVVYNALATHHNLQRKMIFDITVKHHYLLHVAINAKFLNPRKGWCYAGEDFMHTSKEVASSCTRGTPPGLTSKKFLQKYREGMHIEFLEP